MDASNCGQSQPEAEARIQVDRRRLEAMILGEMPGESAEAFFARVQKCTGATVCWPSRLKIRAKTKKDPFVKLAGSAQSVQRAADMIGAALRVKRDRTTLKVEISHCLHSQIIGRGGRNTQKIMRDTDCHIHFPDANKMLGPALPQAKNDQVSVSGCAKDVEKAREMLRAVGPLAVSVSIQLALSRSLCSIQPRLEPAKLQRHFPQKNNCGGGGNDGEVNVQFSQSPTALGSLHFVMRSSSQNELDMLRVFGQICQLIGVFPSGAELFCCSQFEIRPSALPSLNAVRWISFRTNTQIQLNAQGLLISGPLEGIFVARKFIIGLLPVSLHFEKPADLPISSNAVLRAMERELDVQIVEKRRRKAAATTAKAGAASREADEREFSVCTYEANLFNAYLARKRLLQQQDQSASVCSDEAAEDQFPQDSDQAALMRSLCRESLLADQLPLPASLPFPRSVSPSPFHGSSTAEQLAAALIGSGVDAASNCDDVLLLLDGGPKSPDPEESPIAAGLLAGAKSVNLRKGEFRKALDRERMQLKANQAIYNSPPLLELEEAQQRLPTDFWAGYGFSSSLPAELLRQNRGGLTAGDGPWTGRAEPTIGLSKGRGRPIVGRGPGPEEKEEEQPSETIGETDGKPPTVSSPEFGLSMAQRPAAFATIHEREEPMKKATALVHPRVAALQAGEQKKPKFTMSTGGLFDGTLGPTAPAPEQRSSFGRRQVEESGAVFSADRAIQWDIRTMAEPALVLAQLGLAEHVAFFREQEIDMQAFLLLDEGCLTSLGLATLGARRKVMHAVMKLRESARRHGVYSL